MWSGSATSMSCSSKVLADRGRDTVRRSNWMNSVPRTTTPPLAKVLRERGETDEADQEDAEARELRAHPKKDSRACRAIHAQSKSVSCNRVDVVKEKYRRGDSVQIGAE